MMRYLVIGGSAAGISCVEGIRSVDQKAPITLVSDEEFSLYSRCLLSYYLAGTIDEAHLRFKDVDFFKTHAVETLLGTRAEKIDLKSREVSLGGKNKKKVGYDRILIATGGRSRMLELPGVTKRGVFALRTVADARGIESMLPQVKTVVILGGGLIGLKAAYALKRRSLAVKVVVKSGQLLSQILDAGAAGVIEQRIMGNGIEVMKALEAKEIVGKDRVEGVVLDNGVRVDCQLVIIGKGVEPNIGLATDAGIRVGKGIAVDEYLRTSADGVYAAGDVAEARDISTGAPALNAIWPCAVEQGKIAGKNMAGTATVYDGCFGMNSVDFFDLPVISMGITRPAGAGYEELVSSGGKGTRYKKVILKDGCIKGFIALGRIENAGVYHTLLRHQVDVRQIQASLMDDDFNYAKAMPAIKASSERFDKEEFKSFINAY